MQKDYSTFVMDISLVLLMLLGFTMTLYMSDFMI
jgi:hypothetical protein